MAITLTQMVFAGLGIVMFTLVCGVLVWAAIKDGETNRRYQVQAIRVPDEREMMEAIHAPQVAFFGSTAEIPELN